MILQMFKSILVFLLALFLNTNAKAQLKRPHILVGANISYATPRGSFSNAYNFGVGGELSAGLGFGKTYLVGTYGNSIFFADGENNNGNLTINPLKIGIKHYFLANKIFINGDIGLGNVKDKTMSTRESVFMRGIGAGIHFLGLEAGLYYDGWKSLHADGYSNSVLLKVGWNKIF